MTLPDAPAALAERIGHTMVITLNRPAARNAVNSAVSTAVGDAMAEAQADPRVRVVILTGAGDKSFCAGADLKAISRSEILTHPDHPEWGFAGFARHAIDKPTIAAVNASALGGGTELVLASDLAVASADAMFGLPEVKRGLLAAAGGVFRLLDQIPRKRALELIFTGEPISAAEALNLGLINQVVTADSGENAVRPTTPRRDRRRSRRNASRCGPLPDQRGAIRSAPSRRMVSPLTNGFSSRLTARWA